MIQLFIPVLCMGQYEGIYCLNGGFVNRSVKILPEHKFEYAYFDCTGSIAGRGWYEISRTKLKLHFEEDVAQAIDSGKIETELLKPMDSKTCKIELSVTDFSDVLIGAQIELVKDGKGSGPGTVTDFDGYASLAFPRSEMGKILRVSYISYWPKEITIDPSYDYKIKVELHAKPQQIKSGKIYTLKVRHKTKKAFDLVPNSQYERYKKTLASK